MALATLAFAPAALVRALPLAPRPSPPRLADDPCAGRLGPLEVRLARTRREILAAQRLRYAVFYEQGGAQAPLAARMLRRDADRFDRICDHLIVIDHSAARPRIVGTYRLLRRDAARGAFYSAQEFDLAPLLRRHPEARFLELGRSCVLPAYRDKRSIELLWHGIWGYAQAHRIDAMIGCASLDGADAGQHQLALSYLHHFAAAPEAWQVKALPSRAARIALLPREAIALRAALRALPPLLKGYLRVGAFVGEGAVVDAQFGTTDVLVVMPVNAINARYISYFGPNAERHAA